MKAGMERVSTTEICRGKRGAASVRWLVALAPLFLMAAPAKASSSFFTNTGSVCTPTAPCWQAGMFGMLIGTYSGTGATYQAGSLAESGGGSDSITGTGNGGDIGIGPGSTIDTSKGGAQTWTGPIDFADTGNKKSNGYNVPVSSDKLNNLTITGGTLLGQGSVDAALHQILGISNYWAGVSGQTSLVNFGATSTTIGSIGSGIQVFNAAAFNVSSVVTIRGNSSDLIIINDPSTAIFSAGGKIVLSGLRPDQVLFNLTGTGNVLTISGGAAISADFILKQGSYNVSNATVNGRILGGQGTLTMGAGFTEFVPEDAVPEPAAWTMMAAGTGALLYFGRGRRGRMRANPTGRRFPRENETDADGSPGNLP
jgi:hypothetical protein